MENKHPHRKNLRLQQDKKDFIGKFIAFCNISRRLIIHEVKNSWTTWQTCRVDLNPSIQKSFDTPDIQLFYKEFYEGVVVNKKFKTELCFRLTPRRYIRHLFM